MKNLSVLHGFDSFCDLTQLRRRSFSTGRGAFGNKYHRTFFRRPGAAGTASIVRAGYPSGDIQKSPATFCSSSSAAFLAANAPVTTDVGCWQICSHFHTGGYGRRPLQGNQIARAVVSLTSVSSLEMARPISPPVLAATVSASLVTPGFPHSG